MDIPVWGYIILIIVILGLFGWAFWRNKSGQNKK